MNRGHLPHTSSDAEWLLKGAINSCRRLWLHFDTGCFCQPSIAFMITATGLRCVSKQPVFLTHAIAVTCRLAITLHHDNSICPFIILLLLTCRICFQCNTSLRKKVIKKRRNKPLFRCTKLFVHSQEDSIDESTWTLDKNLKGWHENTSQWQLYKLVVVPQEHTNYVWKKKKSYSLWKNTLPFKWKFLSLLLEPFCSMCLDG